MISARQARRLSGAASQACWLAGKLAGGRTLAMGRAGG